MGMQATGQGSCVSGKGVQCGVAGQVNLKTLNDEVKAWANVRVGAPAGCHNAAVAGWHVWWQAGPVAHQDLVERLHKTGYFLTRMQSPNG